MTYRTIFFKLLMYSLWAAPLAFFPAGIFTYFLGYLPGLSLLIFAPIFGVLFSLPAIFIAAYAAQQLIKRNVRSIAAYSALGAVISTVVTSVIFLLVFPMQNPAANVQLFFAGAIVGAYFGWRLKKKARDD